MSDNAKLSEEELSLLGSIAKGAITLGAGIFSGAAALVGHAIGRHRESKLAKQEIAQQLETDKHIIDTKSDTETLKLDYEHELELYAKNAMLAHVAIDRGIVKSEEDIKRILSLGL